MNSQNTPHDPNAEPLDTNVEYISTSGLETQPPIITSVFKSIFVETPRDIYLSIKHFFQRYTSLFSDAYKFLNSPSLKIKPFSTKDYKESCQHTFEWIIIVTGILIFMIKLDWIPAQQMLQQVYNNDLTQMYMQFMIFVIFAVSYLILVMLAVLAGRTYRYLFKIPVTKQEGDILFTYLNNSLFIITAMAAFGMRCFVQAESLKDNDSVAVVVFLIYILGFAFLIWRWAKRFSELNNVAVSKRRTFRIMITISTSLFLGITSAIITFFLLGV